MTTILASPTRQSDRAETRAPRDVEPVVNTLPAPSAATAELDALDWIITACADHLAAAPQPTRSALAGHLLARAGYRIADGFDARAHNVRVDLATGIAARLLESE